MGVSRDCIPATTREAAPPARYPVRQAPARSGATEATGAFQRRSVEQARCRSSNRGSADRSTDAHSTRPTDAAGAARSLLARRAASTKPYKLVKLYGRTTGRDIMAMDLAKAQDQHLSPLHFGQLQGDFWVQRRDTTLPPPDWLWPAAGKPCSAEEERVTRTVAEPEALEAADGGDGGRPSGNKRLLLLISISNCCGHV